ncbi:Dor1-like family-domain-containing protein [Gamsiella multidivaricata]|uniref:Dor1-like family-domain-containing protein n=1 Tax=Gamsiella multidivaricata TaxID=101098 RepID=UPI00221EED9E|nr:Dor1-like family-domain-containing protein [Gamsiella multidivaricata]KAG0366505.1 conserved oligomeric Golgi complex component [Gamsiella multidivaricata]KAI7819775.1 Dor1-like family-domain-containing protein [Gamsiella multidivaricata]
MATELAARDIDPVSHSHSNNTNAVSGSTDQDELFDLILKKVPSEKHEMLSTSWSKDYLNRLTSLPARALHNEPEKLREEQLKVERDMSELAFRDYKAFILVKDCKQDVQSTFGTLGQHLDHFQETIPQFVETLSRFSTKVSPILERQRVFSSILAAHSQLLDVLEIPLLMDTCVRNGYYNEALELASHVQRLVSRYPGIGIIQEIDLKVAQGKEMMLVQLLAQLREPIKLPVALRIIGFLRRIGTFKGQLDMLEEDEHQDKTTATTTAGSSPRAAKEMTGAAGSAFSSASATTVSEDETPLKMLFLKSRGLYMNLQLSKVVHYRGDSFGFLKKYIDVTRECLFDTMTYYKSVFGSIDQYMGLSSPFSSSMNYKSPGASAVGEADSIGQHQQHQRQHYWTTDNLLADFVTYRTQTLLHTLKVHIPQINDTSALSSILTQLMYLGANMSKIGFDLRYLVTSLFEEAVIRVVGGAFQKGADEFLDSLGGEGKNHPEWLLPSQWMLGGTGRTLSSASSSATASPLLGRTVSSADIASGSSLSALSMSPQTCLMDYPPLAYLANSYLTALNSLRLLAPLSLAIPLREILADSLMRMDLSLEEYDRFVFGERASAFRSSFLPATQAPSATATAATMSSSGQNGGLGFRMQGMEGSAVLNEQKIMDGFVVVYKRAVQDYILKCFDEGIYGGLVHVEMGHDSNDITMAVQEDEESPVQPSETPTELVLTEQAEDKDKVGTAEQEDAATKEFSLSETPSSATSALEPTEQSPILENANMP